MRLKYSIALLLMVLVTTVTVAQPAFDSSGPGDVAPLTGLLYVGLATAIGLGVRKQLKK
jgi:hypothetical protein